MYRQPCLMLSCFLCVCIYLTENTAASFTVATYQPRKEQLTDVNTIYKEKSNKMQQCIKILLFHIYMKLNMFRASHRPSSGAWNCTGSLWFFIRGRLLDVYLVDIVRHSVPDDGRCDTRNML